MATNTRTLPWPPLLCIAACTLLGLQPALADDAHEREQLAGLARQLDLAERLAEHAASTAPAERTRYHFDHARLREDMRRIRAGIQDYLTPQRAQPRDAAVLWGDYRAEGRGRAMNPAQLAAFQANGGFTPSDLSALLLGVTFAVLLLWGVWALRTAYTGWSEQHLSQRQFLAVAMRFAALYLVLAFFLLS